MELFSSGIVQLAIALFSVVGAVLLWYLNERQKRAWETYVRKESSYRELLSALRGFYVSAEDRAKKQDFLDQLNQCWLYCRDEVIEKAYEFLDTVKVGAESIPKAKEAACGELVAAIRRDMLDRSPFKTTKLTAEDFRHLTAT